MVEPYLNLSGKSSEAIDFYERVFHGQNTGPIRKLPKKTGSFYLSYQVRDDGQNIFALYMNICSMI